MNILNKLTIKHLKMNKKRTLVTIIGIILSTSLMVGIGLLFSSMLTTEINATIESYGSYNTRFEGLSEKEKDTIISNVNVKNSYTYSPLGFARFENNISSKDYLYVVEGDKTFLETLTLIEGNLPSNDNEILISEDIVNYGLTKYKVGDTIKLDIGIRIVENEELDIAHNYELSTSWDEDQIIYNEEELKVTTSKSYKIVGIITNPVYESYYDAGFMVFSLNTKKSDLYTTYVEYKKPSKSYELTEEITNALNIDSYKIKYNSNLLYYYGASNYSNFRETIIPLMIIALSVISIGCIIVIYNAFAISTMERKKSFGLYASIGATMRQIKHTVLFEALIVGFIGIVLGILGAFLGIFIVIKILNILLVDILNIEIIFSAEPLYIIIPLIFMVIVILLSAYLPAKRSSKISPITAIRGNDDIKISKKEVRTPKFIKKLFGIEGDIAFKNIKRNKKKYRITIISLFISIVMFNTFTSFLTYIVKSTDVVDYYDFDISLNFHDSKNNINNDINTIKNKYNIDEDLTIIDIGTINITNLNNSDFTSQYASFKEGQNNNTLMQVVVLKDEDYAKLSKEEFALLNNKYITVYGDNKRVTKDIEVFAKKQYNLKGICNDDENSISITCDNEFTLSASVINKTIFGLKSFLYETDPVLFTSEATYFNKFNPSDELLSLYLMNTKDYKKIYDDLDNKDIVLKSSYTISSPAINMASVKSLVLAIKILFYGFITLITLIGVTSVINTINTNINLRKKEFAMLRSVGLTPKGFNKLLFFESLFFGLKALIYGIPVSLAINILISSSISNFLETDIIINWSSLLITIVAVFIIVLISMNYASKKIKKENILEALREENI